MVVLRACGDHQLGPWVQGSHPLPGHRSTVVWLSCVEARAHVLYVHGESVQVAGGVV